MRQLTGPAGVATSEPGVGAVGGAGVSVEPGAVGVGVEPGAEGELGTSPPPTSAVGSRSSDMASR